MKDNRLAELLEADVELDAAEQNLYNVSHARGAFATNPMPHMHPAVVAVRKARERRRHAMLAAAAIASSGAALTDHLVLDVYEKRHGTFYTLGSRVLCGPAISPTGVRSRRYKIQIADLRAIIDHAERTGDPE